MSEAGRRAVMGAALAALAFEAGCAPLPRLAASWYLVDGGTTEADGAVEIAILNRGRKQVPIYGISLNQPGPRSGRAGGDASCRSLNQPGPRSGKAGGDASCRMLAPGEIMLFPVHPPDPRTDPVGYCSVPVRVFVRTGPRQRKGVLVEIPGAMPSSLPDRMLKGECLIERAAGSPTG